MQQSELIPADPIEVVVRKPRKFILLYDTQNAVELLSGIVSTSSCAELSCEPVLSSCQENTLRAVDAGMSLNISDKMSCSTCSVVFETRTEQVEHFKSDWHRFNLKLRLKLRPSVKEEAFEEMSGDISSISGSDSESSASSDSESETVDVKRDAAPLMTVNVEHPSPVRDTTHKTSMNNRGTKLIFRAANGDNVSIHRCVLYAKKFQPISSEELLQLVRQLPINMKWAVFMAAGGHFAGAIFDGENVVQHKTFHRYVVRAKRGTAQSQRDSKGHAPKSAGATLRRYNEAALTQEIQDLIALWDDQLRQCSRIFLRAPGVNRAIFFGGKTPAFNKSDSRIRLIPILTRRPTHKELLRLHRTLATVECYDASTISTNHVRVSPRKAFSDKRGTPVGTSFEPSTTTTITKVSKSVESVDQSCPTVAAEDGSDVDDDVDIEWQLCDTTMDLLDLNSFEHTRKPRRRKKSRESHRAGGGCTHCRKYSKQ